MSEGGGFVDLRIGTSAQGIGDDSVWPSFTDIMTVIVMIFLMALVFILVRNYELVEELKSTVIAKEETSLQNIGLESQLSSIEDKMAALRLSLGSTTVERDSIQNQLLQELQKIEALSANNQSLEQQLGDILAERAALARDKAVLIEQKAEIDQQRQLLIEESNQLTDENTQLDQQLLTLSDQLEELQLTSTTEINTLETEKIDLSSQILTLTNQLAEIKTSLETQQLQNQELTGELKAERSLLELIRSQKEQTQEKFASANLELAELNELVKQKELEYGDLKKDADQRGQLYQSLQAEYESLEGKYRKLVRPARSTAGRHVVDVIIRQAAQGYVYQLREPGQELPVSQSREQLDQRLTELRDQYDSKLYTKVIIPDDSQLSHSEAWEFTQQILQNYDYYYREYPASDNSPEIE